MTGAQVAAVAVTATFIAAGVVAVMVFARRAIRWMGPVDGPVYVRRVIFSPASLRDVAVALVSLAPIGAIGGGLRFHGMFLLPMAWLSGISGQLQAAGGDERLRMVAHDRGLELLHRRPATWRTSRWSRPSATWDVDDDTAAAIDALTDAFRPGANGSPIRLQYAAAGRLAGHRALVAGGRFSGQKVLAVWVDVRSADRIRWHGWEPHRAAVAARREQLGIPGSVPERRHLEAQLAPDGLVVLRPHRTAGELGFDELVQLATLMVRTIEYGPEPALATA